MKKQLMLAVAIALLGVVKTQAQGYFEFTNYAGSGLGAPVFDTDGVTRLGSQFVADFIYGPSADKILESAPSGAYIRFSNGGFFGGKQTINDLTGVIYVQVRVWNTSDGASYSAASTTPGAHFGTSLPYQVYLGAAPPPINLIQLQSFKLGTLAVPEPSTIALGVLGLSALVFHRRKVR